MELARTSGIYDVLMPGKIEGLQYGLALTLPHAVGLSAVASRYPMQSTHIRL